jgi:hypothetical protein
MKLFNFGVRKEDEAPPPSIFYIGRNLESTGKFNGLWIRIINPFSKERIVLNPYTFQPWCDNCFWTCAIWVRRRKGKSWGFIVHSLYTPLSFDERDSIYIVEGKKNG